MMDLYREYSFYRRALLTDPNASADAMALVNRYRYCLGQSGRVHPAAAVMCSSLGSTLYHQRVSTGYSLGTIATLCGVSRDVMKRIELGWLIPEGEEGADFLAAVAVYCGFTPAQYACLLQMAERELAHSDDALPFLRYA